MSYRAEILRECLPPTMCHMSGVPFFPGQSCGASRWTVCYQRGLPCLILSVKGQWWRGRGVAKNGKNSLCEQYLFHQSDVQYLFRRKRGKTDFLKELNTFIYFF